MYLVSCRRKLFSPYFFSDMWEVLEFPPGQEPVRLKDARPSSKTISELCWNAKVLVLVHGYNSDDAGLVRAYKEIERRIGGRYDVVIGFLWPGSKVFFGYFTAAMRTERAGKYLAHILRYVRFAKPVRLDVNAHSLGCRVVAEAMKQIPVDLAVLAGPAIDRDGVLEKYPGLAREDSQVLLAWSRTDPVLSVVYPLAGRKSVSAGGAGLDPLEAGGIRHLTQLDLSFEVDSHTGYRESARLYETWLGLMENNPVQASR